MRTTCVRTGRDPFRSAGYADWEELGIQAELKTALVYVKRREGQEPAKISIYIV